ncbi:flagellar type III secretion system pore protein FliP [Agilicoccus flavus]|uniref:flagellar type III secretion system pore protein FliP n=1 Tax=Agilicoccus flavus TaxID=2775968 RepID=UPI001CF60EE0|nr:flagellar type III secretion system pore protein FliP [Agilicoccus flavus]
MTGRSAALLRACALAALAVGGVVGLAAPASAAASAHQGAGSVVVVPASSARTASAHSVAAPSAVAALPAAPGDPSAPATPAPPGAPGISVAVEGGADRSQAVKIIVLMTVLSIAPAILLLMTSFTKIAVVLALTRQALGTPTIPPNQVLAGIALFLSLFVMGPVLGQINDTAVQPFLGNKISQDVAIQRGYAPMRTFMLQHTGKSELATMIKLAGEKTPETRENVSFSTLVPAFVLSELKTAFIIGFVIFIPFLIIDLVVASVLMSMGMMMLPPVMISLPFKLLLFIMVDGWALITTALVTSYR